MSKVEIDGIEYDCPPEVAGLLQAVSEERDELQGIMARAIPKTFGRELTELLNKHSIENVVGMPDFLLAGMICRMIEAMGPSIKKTLDWHDCDSVCHPSPNPTGQDRPTEPWRLIEAVRKADGVDKPPGMSNPAVTGRESSSVPCTGVVLPPDSDNQSEGNSNESR